MNIRRTRLLLAAAALALTASACSSTSSTSAGTGDSTAADSTPVTGESTPSSADVSTTLAPTTTAAPTTLPPVTSPAPAPTTAPAPPPPAPAPLVLRGTGVGTFEFGMSAADVVAGLGARLSPVTDEAAEYPTPDGYGRFISADGASSFTAPYGRVACWSDGAGDELCLSFGGPAAGALSFVGWSYGGHTLLTAGGYTGGSRWSDFPEIFSPGTAGCFNYTISSVAGINLGLLSSGAPFGTYDESGTFTGPDPAPADVSILSLDAGQTPGATEGDC